MCIGTMEPRQINDAFAKSCSKRGPGVAFLRSRSLSVRVQTFSESLTESELHECHDLLKDNS